MSTDAGDVEYDFVCPECAEQLVVNESMKHALLEKGCVICGAELSDEDFGDTA